MNKRRSICFEFKKMDHVIIRLMHKRMAMAGFDQVTIMHGHILGYLYRNRDTDIYQRDIASEFGIGKSTVTNILKLMEKKGYITCTPDAKDGRLKKIELTDEGCRIQLETIKVIEKLHEDMERGISEEERKVFFGIIEKMKKNAMEDSEEVGKC